MNTVNDARWQEWADNVLKTGQKVPMDRKLMEIMTGIFMSGTEDAALGNFFTAENVQNEALPQILRVVLAHGVRIGLKAHRGVAAMCGVLSRGSPGEAVIYVHLFRRIQQRNNDAVVSTTMAVQREFAMGFLSDAALQAAWQSQKLVAREPGMFGDNYLDNVIDVAVEAAG